MLRLNPSTIVGNRESNASYATPKMALVINVQYEPSIARQSIQRVGD
jgi:hypothetical protein